MKILIVVPRLNIGGAESYVYTLVIGLIKKNIEVIVASGGGYLASSLKKQNIKHYYCPIRLSRKFTAYRLKQIISQEKIDLVHANSAGAAYPVSEACAALKVPWIMTAHGIFRSHEAERGINLASKVICVSQFLQQYLLDNTAMTAEQFTVIYNGIDLAAFNPVNQLTNFRSHWKLKNEDFAVGIIARMARLNGKGHLSLIEAMSQEPRGTSWKLIVVGKGKFSWRLKLATWRKGLQDRVVFVGRQIDIPSILNSCDILVLPSQIETFGLVLAEAMAMGKPTIAYAVGGTPEAIVHKKTGYLTTPNDIEQMLRYIRLLQENPSLRKEMGGNGIRRVQQLFDAKLMIKKTVALYYQILKSETHTK